MPMDKQEKSMPRELAINKYRATSGYL